ncbi:M61 family metallopeptidase [Marinigracilibium pacificum]|uniref:M61 family metallopeptidase n=1 Tax=Marinigracilibium pacificum TaxID=2729599 RepID=A0A848IU44_9BACT|nr:M61 family metallopeptidase [Marinigracilibium pacificum]NMM47256.1 M61 family metallopeptidase [Marinigracilibium pacificum]
MQRYTISYEQPLNHWLDIKLSLKNNSKNHLKLSLAGWRPGRYEMAEYASYIRHIRANDDDGNQINISKTDKNTWEIDHASKNITIYYQYYAAQQDAGGSWLDPQLIYLNFINFIFNVSGFENEEITVDINIPDTYKVASALKLNEDKLLIAENYNTIIDSPLFASENITFESYSINNTNFRIAVNGDKINSEKWVNDFKEFSKKQLEIFGEFPFDEYTFLILALPYPAYHGVEHKKSTIIILGPDSEINTTRYNDLLGVSSHELFHAWNVCRIRPEEMVPYDLGKETYHKTGYVTEGFTTYYGDKILISSGVFDFNQYSLEMNKICKRHFQNEGRKYSSLSDSSFDLWVDGYKNKAPDRKVSIYMKGSLCALALDLTIIKNTKGVKSLDDVMKILWVRHGKIEKGYSENDILQVLNEVNGKNLTQEFYSLYHQTLPLESILNPLLNYVGCHLNYTDSQLSNERVFGFKTVDENNSLKVVGIAPGSPAESGLMIGDKIIGVDDIKGLEEINKYFTQEDKSSVTLTISRFGKELKLSLEKNNQNYFSWYEITKNKEVSASQKDLFRKWLNTDY